VAFWKQGEIALPASGGKHIKTSRERGGRLKWKRRNGIAKKTPSILNNNVGIIRIPPVFYL